jgi:hypothetical protein
MLVPERLTNGRHGGEDTQRRPKARRFLLHVLGALLACASAGRIVRASEPCSPTVLTYWFKFQGGDTYIPAVAFDTTIVNTDGDTTRVAFDHLIGRVALSTVGREWAGERVRERFDVSGVPVGTVVPATIAFELQADVLNSCGGGGCGVYFTATLATNADSVMADASIPGPCDSCARRLSTTLAVPVSITAGTPTEAAFAVLYRTTNVAWGRATASGTYRVSGLPPGVRAVACAGADVTPVRRSTWGGLKVLYR